MKSIPSSSREVIDATSLIKSWLPPGLGCARPLSQRRPSDLGDTGGTTSDFGPACSFFSRVILPRCGSLPEEQPYAQANNSPSMFRAVRGPLALSTNDSIDWGALPLRMLYRYAAPLAQKVTDAPAWGGAHGPLSLIV